jgi:hypothetical protein
MVLIGMLLAALVCLALGLVLASAGWLVASLAATAVAAFVMWTKRKDIAAPAAAKAPEPAAAVGDATEDDEDHSDTVDAEYRQRRAAWFAEGTADGDVWVIDGQPNYHCADCALLVGQSAEPVPFAQASEDGFTACAVCDPDATVTVPPVEQPREAESAVAPHPQPEPVAGPVSVTASQPAARTVPTPQAAAVRDGKRAEVWVVDGRPRFHRADCMIIKGQDAEPIPFEQASEDGFVPCSLCEPNALSR